MSQATDSTKVCVKHLCERALLMPAMNGRPYYVCPKCGDSYGSQPHPELDDLRYTRAPSTAESEGEEHGIGHTWSDPPGGICLTCRTGWNTKQGEGRCPYPLEERFQRVADGDGEDLYVSPDLARWLLARLRQASGGDEQVGYAVLEHHEKYDDPRVLQQWDGAAPRTMDRVTALGWAQDCREAEAENPHGYTYTVHPIAPALPETEEETDG